MNDSILWWRFWICLALAVVLLMAMGCATLDYDLPACPKITLHPVQTERGALFIMDMQGLAALAARMNGLWERSCKPREGV